MIHLVRLSAPGILDRKKAEWTEKFLEKRLTNSKARPDHNKYGHHDIISKLLATSSHKCFYSGEMLKGNYREIDHHIEVDEKPEDAYEWDNLYLSSSNCNDKLPNIDIAVSEVLNPFRNSDDEIENNLYFEDEYILSDSELGKKTIKKYRLDSENLDLKRSKLLHKFKNQLIEIKSNIIKEGRDTYNDEEALKLKRFADKDAPFSLMFRLILKKYNI
ncbi:hypothetical protein [Chryseobacterium hagamense]|uniref:TIGR02646 family protein n=1 Tax=Chryseobacterium hagamense TaxID=395935 RepID=A0A511YMJ0_9FLAO|nr:hypothetical protein [Chryseobacterium hagamense]GEN76376.1 hypothetical protein CHA01nite_21160 [Chryseobacterium hagamense]